MSEDYVKWERLPEYPVYSATRMKPDPRLEGSIINLIDGATLTPGFAYENTTKFEDRFDVRIFTKKHNVGGGEASVSLPINKDFFTKVLSACCTAKPSIFTWEDPEFYTILDKGVVDLAELLNKHNVGIFIRSGLEYCLGNETGVITNNGAVSGKFAGVIITSSNGNISVKIPKFIHNSAVGLLSKATLTYTDPTAGLKIVIDGAALSHSSGVLSIAVDYRNDNISISKIGNGAIYHGEEAPMISKKLWVPMTKLEYRVDTVNSILKRKQKDTVVVQRATNVMDRTKRCAGLYKDQAMLTQKGVQA